MKNDFPSIPRLAFVLGFAFSTALFHPGTLCSQDDAAKDGNQAEKDELREKTIYIPFEKLRDVFEKDERKVVLSYEEFDRLWKAARKLKADPPKPESKRGAIIAQADSKARIRGSVVTVTSRLKIEIFSRGWSEVVLGLKDSAIKSSQIKGKDARIVFDPKVGYRLLIENDSDETKSIELELEYARAFDKSPGQSTVEFQAPKAPVNRWEVRIDQPQVKIDIEPMIAVTSPEDAQEEGTSVSFDPAKETVVLAFLGVAPKVKLKWNPKSEGASGLDAVVSAQTVQQVTVDKNVQRTQVQVGYEISRAELPSLKIEVPGDQKVTNVFNENVKKWSVEKQDENQIISIELFSPIKGTQSLTFELEKLTEEKLKQDFTSSMVNVLDASRQQGIVVYRFSDGLRSVSKNRLGLLQLDRSELPSQLARGNWALAYRYAALPYQLDLSIEKILPRILAQQLTEVELSPQKVLSHTRLIYDVQEAGVFSTQLKVPPTFKVRSIAGFSSGKGIQAIPVSEYRQDDSDANIWNVDFSRKAFGKVGLRIELEQDLSEPNLLTPTGESAQLAIPVPTSNDPHIEYTEGNLVVSGPESLRVNPLKENGLQQVTVAKAFEKLKSQGNRIPGSKAVLSYSFAGDLADLELDVTRRKPRVTVRQLLTAKIESGVVKYDARLFYEILYSGVKTIRVDIPQTIAGQVRNITNGVTESEIESPEDLQEGYVAWNFSREAEWFGNQEIHLTWEEKIGELEIGKSIDIDLPRLSPKQVDRADGQIVASKSETIDIQPREGVEGLIPIDPKVDLMAEAKIKDAAAAFEFVDNWKLPLRATRYDVEDVKLTNVEAGLVQMVKLRQEGLSVRALFRIRSAVQRLGLKLPKGVKPSEAFDSQPVRVNGNPINLELGTDDELFVPLTGIQTDEAFLLDLRYKANSDNAQLVLPTFSGDPAMQKVFLCVYVPQEQAVIGSHGPWTNELLKDKSPGQILFEGTFNEYRVEQLARERVSEIEKDIFKGVKSFTTAPDFKIDGRSYLFSSLRPDPEQQLQVLSVSRWWINALLVGSIVVIGLPLYRRPLTWQLATLFLLIAAVVLAGVFLPMLARQLLGSVLFISLGLLILVWSIGHATNMMVLLKKTWATVTGPDEVDYSQLAPADQGPPPEPDSTTGTESQPRDDRE